MKDFIINIYSVEGLFILGFVCVLATGFWLKTKLTKKEGWDFWGIMILFLTSVLFVGIYGAYEQEYKHYKAAQKAKWEETTKNWTQADWDNYDAQQNEPDYQPGAYGPE